ncbi:MAG: hypothetical protein WCJ58_08145 [bacterium]
MKRFLSLILISTTVLLGTFVFTNYYLLTKKTVNQQQGEVLGLCSIPGCQSCGGSPCNNVNFCNANNNGIAYFANSIPGNVVRVVLNKKYTDTAKIVVVAKNNSKVQTITETAAGQTFDFTFSQFGVNELISTLGIGIKYGESRYAVGFKQSAGSCPGVVVEDFPSAGVGFQQVSYGCWSDAPGQSSTCDFNDFSLKIYVKGSIPSSTPTQTPTPIPNQPPSCQWLKFFNLAGTEISKALPGDAFKVVCHPYDNDGSVTNVNFFYTPEQANYCKANIWTAIPGATFNAGTGNWEATFTAPNTLNGTYKFVSSIRDNDGAWCTGNPAGTCGNPATSSCPNCNNSLSIGNTAPATSVSIIAKQCPNSWSGAFAPNLSMFTINGNPTNNPLTLTSTFSDSDGINQLDVVGLWLSNLAPFGQLNAWNTYANDGLYIRLKKVGTNSYQFLYYTDISAWQSALAPIGPNNITAVCTSQVTGDQALCNISTVNGAITILNGNINAQDVGGWIAPLSVYENANNLTVTWKIGITTAGGFLNYTRSPNLKIYSVAKDKLNAVNWYSGESWKVDLTIPIADAPSVVSGLPNGVDKNFTVTYAASDDISGLARVSPFGQRSNFASSDQIDISSGTDSFQFKKTTIEKVIPFFNHYLNPGKTFSTNVPYTASNINLTTGKIQIGLEASDQACNNVISATKDLETNTTSWMLTKGGDTFSHYFNFAIPVDTITGTNLNLLNNQSAFASTFLYLQAKNNTKLGIKASFNHYEILNYTDLNYAPRPENGTSWFTQIASRARKYTKSSVYKINGDTNISNISTNTYIQGKTGFSDEIHIIDISGTLTLSQVTCDNKTIFIAENLVINPYLNTLDITAACLMLISGKTTVNSGLDSTAGPDIEYDHIQVFIITNEFQSTTDAHQDGLLIFGGLITNANSISSDYQETNNNPINLDRKLNTNNTPAEALVYDGTKYMYLFADILNKNSTYSIKEKQFIEGLIK